MLRRASDPRIAPYVSLVVVEMGEGRSGFSERERRSDMEMLAAQVSAMLYLACVSYLSIHYIIVSHVQTACMLLIKDQLKVGDELLIQLRKVLYEPFLRPKTKEKLLIDLLSQWRSQERSM